MAHPVLNPPAEPLMPAALVGDASMIRIRVHPTRAAAGGETREVPNRHVQENAQLPIRGSPRRPGGKGRRVRGRPRMWEVLVPSKMFVRRLTLHRPIGCSGWMKRMARPVLNPPAEPLMPAALVGDASMIRIRVHPTRAAAGGETREVPYRHVQENAQLPIRGLPRRPGGSGRCDRGRPRMWEVLVLSRMFVRRLTLHRSIGCSGWMTRISRPKPFAHAELFMPSPVIEQAWMRRIRSHPPRAAAGGGRREVPD